MKHYVGLVMCVALVAVITSTSANEVGLIYLTKKNPAFWFTTDHTWKILSLLISQCKDLEAEIEVLEGLLYTSMRFNLEAELAKETSSQDKESLKKWEIFVIRLKIGFAKHFMRIIYNFRIKNYISILKSHANLEYQPKVHSHTEMTFNREISSIQKDLKISEDCCKKDDKTAEGKTGPAFKFQSIIFNLSFSNYWISLSQKLLYLTNCRPKNNT